MTWAAVAISAGLLCLALSGTAGRGKFTIASGPTFDRLHGPMTLRFFLQPTMAFIAALHEASAMPETDTNRSSGPRYGTRTMTDGRLHEGLISTARIMLPGLSIDVIYQFRVFDRFYPAEADDDGAPARRHSVFRLPMDH